MPKWRSSPSVCSTPSWWSHFLVLLLRNANIKRSRIFGSGKEELFAPIGFLVGVIFFVKFVVSSPVYYQPITKEGVASHVLDAHYASILLASPIAVAPDTAEVRLFLDGPVQQTWGQFNNTPLNFTYYVSSDVMESAYITWTSGIKIAVIFIGNPLSSLNITLRNDPRIKPLPRVDGRFADTSVCRVWPEATLPIGNEGGCPATQYLDSGITPLQAVLQYAWMQNHTGLSHPHILFQLFPKPGGASTNMMTGMTALRFSVTIHYILALTSFLLPLMYVVVEQKQNKDILYLQLQAGMIPYSAYYLSWFCVQLVSVILTSLVTCAVSVVVLPHSSFVMLFILFVLFSISVIAFTFVFVPFFSHVKTCALLKLLVSFLAFLSVLQIQGHGYIPIPVLWFFSIFSPCAFGFAFDQAVYVDAMGVDTTFESLWRTDAGGLSIAGGLIMIAFDTIIYFIIGCIIHHLHEGGRTNTMKHQLQCFIRRIFGMNVMPTANYHQMEEQYSTSNFDAICEQNGDDRPTKDNEGSTANKLSSSNPREAIILKNVSKNFKYKKNNIMALKDVSLSLCEGHITVIVGHSGAGKTTLLNLLCGFGGSYEGHITAYGNNVAHPIMVRDIRRMSGLCLKKDSLPSDLTVIQHMKLCAFWKGVNSVIAKKEIEYLLEEFNLTKCKNDKIGTLSVLDRRKISIASSLIGNPKIILLDEPTCGMDSESTEKLWNLLEEMKDRVIVVTSRYIRDANIFGTRMVLLSRGYLRCYGDSSDMRKILASNYKLSVNLHDAGRADEVFGLVKSVISQVERTGESGGKDELVINISQEKQQLFPKMLDLLDAEICGEKLRGASYKISMTTLEEGYSHLRETEELETYKEDKEKEIIKDEKPNFWRKYFTKFEKTKTEPSDVLTPTEIPKYKSTNCPTTCDKFCAFFTFRLFVVLHNPFSPLVFCIILPLMFPIVVNFFMKQDTFPINNILDVTSGMYNDSGILYSMNWNKSEDISTFISTMKQILSGGNSSTVSVLPYNGSFDFLANNGSHWLAMDFISSSSNWANIQVRFNDTDQHTLPVVITTITQTVMKMSSENETKLSVYIKPFPTDVMPFGIDHMRLMTANFYGIIFSVVVRASLSLFILDKDTGVSLLLRLNDLPFTAYLAVQFTLLIGTVTIAILHMALTMFGVQLVYLPAPAAIGALCIHTAIYCVDVIVLCMCASLIIKSKESLTRFQHIANLLGIIPFFVISFLDMMGNSVVASILHCVACFIDPFYLPYGLFYFINKQSWICIGQEEACHITWNFYFRPPELAIPLVAEFIHIALAILIIINITNRIKSHQRPSIQKQVCKTWHRDKESMSSTTENKESSQEDHHPPQQNGVHSPVVIKNLYKEYKKPQTRISCCSRKKESDSLKGTELKVAVNDLSMSLEPGEVIGLLGHGGAGKTTILRIIIGEEIPTSGKCIADVNIVCSSCKTIHSNVSYCPQNNMLYEGTTARDHLQLFARLRGISKTDTTVMINQILKLLSISKYADKKIQHCSESTKRIISIAIAIIGTGSRLVLLDEPSTGIDPETRKQLWNVISTTFHHNKSSAIITTTMAADSKAMCSKVALLLNGRLKCFGTLSQVEENLCSNYFLEIKVKYQTGNDDGEEMNQQRRMDGIVKFFQKHFPSSILRKNYQRFALIEILENNKSLKSSFQIIQKAIQAWDLDVCVFGKRSLDGTILDHFDMATSQLDSK